MVSALFTEISNAMSSFITTLGSGVNAMSELFYTAGTTYLPGHAGASHEGGHGAVGGHGGHGQHEASQIMIADKIIFHKASAGAGAFLPDIEADANHHAHEDQQGQQGR